MALTALVGQRASAAPPATVVVEHRERQVSALVDPFAAISVAFLIGDELQVPEQLRGGAVAPSWMLTWTRQLTIAWQLPPKARLASHPLSHLAPRLLALDGPASAVAASTTWSGLTCAPAETAELDARVLARSADGIHLIGLDLRCRAQAPGPARSRWRRLIVRTDGLGRAQAAAGLETQLLATRWPVRPAMLRKQPIRTQLVEGSYVASVDLDATPEATAGVEDHGPLPQPERFRTAPTSTPPPRAVVAFDARGEPAQLLIRDGLAPTPAEAEAAAIRRPLERDLPPSQTAAPPALDDAVATPLWLHDGEGALLLLELGRRADDQSVHDAAIAGWRWRDGAWRRVDVALPRTAAEGRWTCGADASAGALLCTFDRPPLPTARGFSPQRLMLQAKDQR